MKRSIMVDTIVLLTPDPRLTALADVLQGCNPGLTVTFATTLVELEASAPPPERMARLLAFATAVIVPPDLLGRFACGAYNFHPGPPTYPGWAPAAFAIYDGATSFGVTAHRMVKEVDAGPIVGVEWFDVAPSLTLQQLELQAFSHLAKLFWRLAVSLATQIEPLAEIPVTWSGRKSTRRHCVATCDIPVDIGADELKRRVDAFGQFPPDLAPTITLHGFQFRIAGPPTQRMDAA